MLVAVPVLVAACEDPNAVAPAGPATAPGPDGSAAVKDRLRQEVDAAIARGVFGSPFFFLDNEPFWGHDRLDQVDRWLETGGW